MLKCRVIPILTFSGLALVKTKQFAPNPRMVGNAVQAARVFNSRNVDELVFLDIYASDQKRKNNLQVVKSTLNECFIPVAIGGGISSIKDINDLLETGADKVVIKSAMIENPDFLNEAANIFSNQCLTIAIDAIKKNGEYYLFNRMNKTIPLVKFIKNISGYNFGEVILNSVDHDGMMNGFDIEPTNLVEKLIDAPIVVVGGGGKPEHFKELFLQTKVEAVGASSIFYFTRYTPLDVKLAIQECNRSVRIINKDNILSN